MSLYCYILEWIPSGSTCVLRLRYNITTMDFVAAAGWQEDTSRVSTDDANENYDRYKNKL